MRQGALCDEGRAARDDAQRKCGKEDAYFKHITTTCSAMMQSIVNLPQPAIAAVQGPASAAGCQLVARCDLAIAAEIGLVNRVAPAGEEREIALALAHRTASKSSYTLKACKEAFYRQPELGLAEAYAYACEVITENMMARDAHAGICAFIEKRKPTWQDYEAARGRSKRLVVDGSSRSDHSLVTISDNS